MARFCCSLADPGSQRFGMAIFAQPESPSKIAKTRPKLEIFRIKLVPVYNPRFGGGIIIKTHSREKSEMETKKCKLGSMRELQRLWAMIAVLSRGPLRLKQMPSRNRL